MNNMKTLQETATPMLSKNYKDRFKAEYWQTKIRYEKLKKRNTKVEALNYMEVKASNDISSPYVNELFRKQQSVMGEYLHILEVRAAIEGVDLDD